jgi:hypothetical protein
LRRAFAGKVGGETVEAMENLAARIGRGSHV